MISEAELLESRARMEALEEKVESFAESLRDVSKADTAFGAIAGIRREFLLGGLERIADQTGGGHASED